MIKNPVSKKKLKEFGFVIGFGFPIIIGWILPAITGHIFRFWTLWIGFTSVSLALFKPLILLYPYKAWMVLGHILGLINSRIILVLVFIFVLLPISFVMKTFGYDPLRIKKLNQNSYRELKNTKKVDLSRIF